MVTECIGSGESDLESFPSGTEDESDVGSDDDSGEDESDVRSDEDSSDSESDADDAGDSAVSQMNDDSDWPKGTLISRQFEGVSYIGTVTHILPATADDEQLWHVRYADGDEEDLNAEEMRLFRDQYLHDVKSKKKRKKEE